MALSTIAHRLAIYLASLEESTALTETTIATALATKGLTDAQARAAIAGAASVAAGLRAIGLTVDAVATSSPTPTSTPQTSARTTGYVGQNLAGDDLGRDSFGAVSINKAVNSDPWSSGGDPLPTNQIDANGFPLLIGKGGYNETLTNVESVVTRPNLLPAQNIHVIESNCGISPATDECIGGAYISDTTDSNGVRRIEFRPNPAVTGPRSYPNAIRVFMHGPIPSSGGFYRLFHKEDEAELRQSLTTGKVYRQQFINRIKGYSRFRFMDWTGIKSNFGNAQESFSQFRTKDSVTWADQVPLEHQIGLCNEAGADGHFNLPHTATDQFVRDFMAKFILPYDATTKQGGLAPNLVAAIENTNEPWDPGSTQYSHYSNPDWPLIAGSNDRAWAAYGYRSALMAMIVMKAVNYDSRFRPYIGFQAGYTAQMEGVILGVKAAIAERSDPTSTPRDLVIGGKVVGRRGYDAEFAARFKEPGQLFKEGGGACYLGAGMGRTGWDTAGRNKFKAWAQATDDSGLAGFFNQMYTGQEMLDPNGFNLASWVTTFAPEQTILDREQIRRVPYEGSIVVEDFVRPPLLDAEMLAFRTRAMNDPRMIQLTKDWMAKNVLAGADFVENLCELSGPGGAYGSRENPFIDTFPRDVGLLQVQANPPAPLPLTIEVVTTGPMRVGGNPKTRMTVKGGRGQITVGVAGAVAGRTFDGFRTVDGVITAAVGDQPGLVTATDERGVQVTAVLPQNVMAAAVYPSGRYLRAYIARPGNYVDVDYIGVIDANGVTHNAVWTGNNNRSPNLDVEDGQTDFALISDTLVGDLGAVFSAAKVIVTRANNGNYPLNVQVWITSASDGSGGTLILDLHETEQANGWSAARRLFDVSA